MATIKLTDEEHAVLADVVVDPHKWVADAIAGKIDKHRAAYEERKAAMGADYKNRAERQAEEDAARRAEALAHLAAAQAKRETK